MKQNARADADKAQRAKYLATEISTNFEQIEELSGNYKPLNMKNKTCRTFFKETKSL